MTLNRNKFYLILFIACLAGYVWLYFNVTNFFENKSIGGCLIKHVTNIPCPSCGVTRSVVSLIRGDFIGALNFNPIGYLVTIIMFISPLWIAIDIISKTQTLFDFYCTIEVHLTKPLIAISLSLLVATNWIWNIIKEL